MLVTFVAGPRGRRTSSSCARAEGAPDRLNTKPGMWMGPNQLEGTAAYKRAREAGMSFARSEVLGHIGSFRDCWTFRRKIAERCNCSIRTVQRAITQGKMLGLIGVARLKKHETPPGADGPLTCSGSHRWTNGYGLAGEAAKRAVDAARLKWIERAATHAVRSKANKPRRKWTAEELDAELERIQRERETRARDGP